MKNITINNCIFKTYLIGSMESPAKLDGGVGWRQRSTPELNKRQIYCFDPTREEMAKIGMPTAEFMTKLIGWQKSGHWNQFICAMRKIWRGVSYTEINKKTGLTQVVHIFGDVSYVENSKFLIWNLDDGDKPGGTIAELTIAWYRGIPVYLITSVPKTQINKSILYFLLDSGHGQGSIFKNQEELLEFLDKKYELKGEQEMQRKTVKSDSIKSIGYNISDHVLEVEFTRGAIYQYFDISADKVLSLTSAKSIGSFFSKNIAKSYRYLKVKE